MEVVSDEQRLHRSLLEELTSLAIRINSRTRYRASVVVDGKHQCFKVIVYVNDEKESKIATYRNFIRFEEVFDKADECRERLEYFLTEGRVS